MLHKRHNLSQRMTKPSKWHVRPTKTWISLGIRPVWSESSLCARAPSGWLRTHSFFMLDSEDSDQTGRMPRLIWVFAGCICRFVGFVMRWVICFKTFYLVPKTHALSYILSIFIIIIIIYYYYLRPIVCALAVQSNLNSSNTTRLPWLTRTRFLVPTKFFR